jgi:hypothetical protein
MPARVRASAAEIASRLASSRLRFTGIGAASPGRLGRRLLLSSGPNSGGRTVPRTSTVDPHLGQVNVVPRFPAGLGMS